MLTYEQIEKALQDRVLSRVSRESGVNRMTISAIKNGHNPNITRETQRRLSEYLQGQAPGQAPEQGQARVTHDG